MTARDGGGAGGEGRAGRGAGGGAGRKKNWPPSNGDARFGAEGDSPGRDAGKGGRATRRQEAKVLGGWGGDEGGEVHRGGRRGRPAGGG